MTILEQVLDCIERRPSDDIEETVRFASAPLHRLIAYIKKMELVGARPQLKKNRKFSEDSDKILSSILDSLGYSVAFTMKPTETEDLTLNLDLNVWHISKKVHIDPAMLEDFFDEEEEEDLV